MAAATLPSSESMRARYNPQPFPAAEALRLIGKRDEVHPYDVVAFLYPSQEAADVFARANLERHEVKTLGHAAVDGGVVGVLLPPLLMFRDGPTDPALPDDWTPRKDRTDG